MKPPRKRSPPLVPSLIVPDEQTWTMLGKDPAALGAEPSFQAAATAAILMPERVPDQLQGPLSAYLSSLPGAEHVQRRPLALPLFQEAKEVPDPHDPIHEPAMGGSGREEDHHDHADGDGDMMAIVGEPSADGLVMERIDLSYGPLGVPFPGGLKVEATLDGELVTKAVVSGLPAAAPSPSPPSPPDPLAPAAWAIAIARTGDIGPSPAVVAALELERAISHLAWLRSLFRLLGWKAMISRSTSTLAALNTFDLEAAEDASALDRGGTAIAGLVETLGGSRMLRWRLGGLGRVSSKAAEEQGLNGPNARASGLPLDFRIEDPLYTELSFEPLLERDGDAAARTMLRAREAGQSIALAQEALATKPADGAGRAVATAVEGPRGTLRVERVEAGLKLRTPGGEAARSLAAEAMLGESWEDALAVLASFDLSPWETSA